MNRRYFENAFTYRALVAILLASLSLAAVAHAQGQKPVFPPAAGAHPPGTKPAASAPGQGKKSASGEEFFIVASIDQAKSQVLLKQPSEVTVLVKVTDKTQYLDESGKAIKLSDLRSGDTVWAVSSGGPEPAAVRIRKGQMTEADLHRYYLDYPEIK
ncbi:MAG: hypothetical protein ABSE45_09870 [Candidatus Acidiferrales bacterium]|jgi:hypothetical protein